MPSKTTTEDQDMAYSGSCLTNSLGDLPEIEDSAEIAVRTDLTFAAPFASVADDRYAESETNPIVASTESIAMTTMISASVNARNRFFAGERRVFQIRWDTESAILTGVRRSPFFSMAFVFR